MRKLILLLGIVAQVGVLAYMVYGRESIVQSGQRIEITTAPIDPRDPFRGDFVRLAYPMNSLSFNVSTVTGESHQFPRDAVFYTSLKPEPGGTYAAYQFGDEKPSEGVFDLRYGLEQMFVEQGSGIAIEERQGVRGGLQVPMHVEVALGDNGTGIITGFRWNAVGAQLEIGDMELPRETDGEPSNESSEPEPALWLTLQNVSAEPVQMSLAGELCHLSPTHVGMCVASAMGKSMIYDSSTHGNGFELNTVIRLNRIKPVVKICGRALCAPMRLPGSAELTDNGHRRPT